MKSHKIKRYNRRLFKLAIPMLITALLCIASPNAIIATSVPVTPTSATIPINQSVSQARQLYQEGKYSEAAKLFQQAAQFYKTANNPLQQALNLSNLSLCYQQLGQWDNADHTITEAIKILNTNKEVKSDQISALAQALDIQGGLQLARGQTDTALNTWERATSLYTQLGKPSQILASQVSQAQALQNLGLYRRAIELLNKALKLPSISTANINEFKTALQSIPPSPETANALRTLGDSLRVVGNLPQAKIVLERSLAIAQQLKRPETIALAQLSLGNTARAQLNFDNTLNNDERAKIDPQAALNYYQQAATSNPSVPISTTTSATLNQLSLLVDSNQQDAAKNLLPQIKQQIETLPPSQTAMEARINLAQTMMRMREKNSTLVSERDIAQILAIAVQQSQDLGNPRTQAYALGSLGSVYETTQQWQEAEKLTQEALKLSQQISAGDIAYLWQWQLGRVTKAQGKHQSAIASYKEAVGTIKSLRADLAGASPDVQFSFRNAVEPIHRELVELLVESNQKDNLKIARDVIEGLQLVELDNFFREACLNAKPEQVDKVDNKAAVIYPIILKDQLAIIASLPKTGEKADAKDNRDFRYYKTNIKSKEVEQLASRLRENLGQSTTFDLTLPQLQKMYDLVIRPEAADLATSRVETLVFVLDGALRNIPMSALHDGKQFLVEKYSIALTPGLQLLAPRSLRQERLGALVAGIGEARQGFDALPYVEEEVRNIKSEVPSQVLLNEKFTNPAFQNKVSTVSSPIVHLATHGQFGSNAEETFIVTWDGKIKVNQLSSLLKTVELSRDNSLELLVLSACETATGDARSALGLAGVAVRSGARSTVATLWRVNDEASATLMSKFYDQLSQVNKTGISKAEALRRAQINILKNPVYKSPYYWAAYVLLGNWT